MIYELRVYHAVPGRLPDLLKRFDSITLKIWQRHGIEQAGFWTTLVGEFEPGALLSFEMGVARRAREEVEHLSGRSGMAPPARRDRSKRPDRAARRELVPGADQLLLGEVTDFTNETVSSWRESNHQSPVAGFIPATRVLNCRCN